MSCASRTHAIRFLWITGAAVALAASIPTDARAQFACVGTIGASDVTCTNTGTTAVPFVQDQLGTFNLITTSSGASNGITTTSVDGNVTATNSGINADMLDTSASGLGNATSNNSGSVASFIVTTAGGGGNATTNNSGTVAGLLNTQTSNGGVGFGAGTATSINSGIASVIITQTFDGGIAVTTNSGKVLNSIQTMTIDGGNATTINTGVVNGSIATASGLSSGDGNATTVNAGVVHGFIQSGVGGNGNAVTVNSGSVLGGMLSAVAGDGNAVTTNFGYVTGPVISQAAGNGHASVVNYGTIDSQGLSPVGAQVMFGAASVTNVGRILGTVGASVFFDGTATITNAGLIDGSVNGIPTGSAIFFDADPSNPAAHTTLNILPGSRIIGTIELAGDTFYPGSGTSVNIFSGHDISSVLTFGANCGCGFVGGLTDTGAIVNVTGGAPYVINGNTVAVLDPTSFAMQDRNVIDVTRTITSLVTSRLTNPAPIGGNGSSAMGFAPSGNVARDMANDAFSGIPALAYAGNDRVLLSNPSFTAADGTSIWAQGFGGQRIQQADAPTLRSVNNFYGGVLGVDKTVQPGLRLGGFIGAGNVKSTIALNSGETTSDMVFGGIYGRYALARAFLDFSLLGGGSSNDVKRTIANNLVPGGYEYAAGKYNGWFISPEIAYGLNQSLGTNLTLTPSARVRYLAAGFGGYDETGSTTNLSVRSRVSHNFEERGEFKLTHTTNATPAEQLQLSGTAGLIALQRVGDSNVNTILLGQSLAFATPGKASIVGFYAGAGFDWRHVSGISVFGATEFTAMSDSSQTITGRGGVKVAF